MQFCRTLRQSFQMSQGIPNTKFYSCFTKLCIQCPFCPGEKQIQYLFAYVRLSPLGTGPKCNNHLLLRRWLWTKQSWWSISHGLIYSCASAKQPKLQNKTQTETPAGIAEVPWYFGTQVWQKNKNQRDPLCFCLLSSLMKTEACRVISSHVTHMNSCW